MMQENLALITSRQAQSGFRHALITNQIASLNSTGTAGRYGSGYVFPLYLYPDEDLYNNNKTKTYQRQVNIDQRIFEALKEVYGKKPPPEAILYYIYAVLYSNTYRQKYAEFLKTDFPRVPFCRDYDLFRAIAKSGKNLAHLHLMKSKKLDKPIAKFEGSGDNLVTKVLYNEKESLVYINSSRYFGPISKDIWEYQIGGYQVMAKWLKDRKDRRLSLENIKQYCRIATAMKETMNIQKQIDTIYTDAERQCVNI